MLTTDILVIGSGAAGLAAALEAARRGANVHIATGEALLSGSSPRAQGGVAAAVGLDDDVALHDADTLAVGAGLNDRRAVSVLVREGASAARQLLRDGAPFEIGEEGPELGLEAGHSRRRILHAGGGATGLWLTRFLAERVLREPRITVREHAPLVQLDVQDGRVVGARFEDPAGREWTVRTEAVVLATGGAGALWGRTTNAPETRGVGIGLAWEAGATLADLEMVQFHPTALLLPGQSAFLLSEALRGEGALLVDLQERPFVDPLLPRDVVARAVAHQIDLDGGAYLSLRHLDASHVHETFQSLSRQVAERGLDLARDLLPVGPAAHYLMGGVRTDADGRTDVPGLYAAGEVACTGAQGANRLASNSLLECLVFGRRAADAAIADSGPDATQRPRGRATGMAFAANPTGSTPSPRWGEGWGEGSFPPSSLSNLTPTTVGELLDRYVSVTRDEGGLVHAISALPDPNSLDTLPDLRVAGFAARAALLRRESRGAHFRSDFPETDVRWQGRICWRRGEVPTFEEV